MTDNDIKELKRLGLLIFMELQEIKDLLKIRPPKPSGLYDWENRLSEYMIELDSKQIALIKEYPKLTDDPPK